MNQAKGWMQRLRRYGVGVVLATAALGAQADYASSFKRLQSKAAEQGDVRVIVVLKTDRRQHSSASKGPLPLGQYIEDVQSRALNEIGWVNFNELVKYKYTPAMAMTVRGDQLRRLQSASTIEGVYEDRVQKLFLAESTPHIRGSGNGIESASGKGQSVVVIDSGVDRNHPFFSGRVVAEACFSVNQSRPDLQLRSTCPGGQVAVTGPGAAAPCPLEGCAHGTHVAGIAAGRNGSMTGVAPDANIVAIQAGTLFQGPNGTSLGFLDSSLLQALEWVYENREKYSIAAVNMSLGGGRFEESCDQEMRPYAMAIDLLYQAGVATVIASGNESFTKAVAMPACVSRAISVGATDESDHVAEFSNSANQLDLLAPGIDQSPAVPGRGIYSSVPGGQFARMPGTSMAAPHVAGAYVALRSVMPKASVEQITTALRETGLPVEDGRNGVRKPRIQLSRALAYLREHAAPPPPPKPKPTPAPPPKPKPAPKPAPAEPPPPPVAEPEPVEEPPQEAPRRRDSERNYGGVRIYDDKEESTRGSDGKIRW